MKSPSHCPECENPIPARATSCSCGWKAPSEQGAAKQYHDPLRHVCAWTVGGQRCQNPGAISSGTKGEGPWYCGPHFRCDNQQDGMRIIVESMRKAGPSAARPVVVSPRPVEELRAECAALIGAKPNERAIPATQASTTRRPQAEPGELG